MSNRENLIEDLLRHYRDVASFRYTREELEKLSEDKLKSLCDEFLDDDEEILFNGLLD